MSRTLRPVIVVALAIAAFLVPASMAYALWSASASGALTVTTALAAPAGVTCGAVTSTSVVLSWASSGSDVQYRIYRTDTNAVVVNNISGLTTTVPKGSLPNNVHLAIRAFNATSESANGTPVMNVQFQANRCSSA